MSAGKIRAGARSGFLASAGILTSLGRRFADAFGMLAVWQWAVSLSLCCLSDLPRRVAQEPVPSFDSCCEAGQIVTVPEANRQCWMRAC